MKGNVCIRKLRSACDVVSESHLVRPAGIQEGATPPSARTPLRLDFADFWSDFSKTHNGFMQLLENSYDITIADDPDWLIFSAFGNRHLQYDCTKIFYTGENVRPNFDRCDWAFSFDFLDDPRHYRLPNYVFYGDVRELTKPKPPVDQVLAAKRHFCCMLVSNPNCQERNHFFRQLSKYRQVHSGGWCLNNIGGPVPKTINGKPGKVEFISNFKFVIAFENGSYPGYTTEKIFEPMLVNSIPIYWGNPLVDRDFNTKSFVNCHDYRNFEEVIERIIAIDTNEAEYRALMEQPYFVGNTPNKYVQRGNILKQFDRIFTTPRRQSLRRAVSARFYHSIPPLRLMAEVNMHHIHHPMRSAKSLWRRAKSISTRLNNRGANRLLGRLLPGQQENCWCGGKLGDLPWGQWSRHYRVCLDCGCYVNRQPHPPEARRDRPHSQEYRDCCLSLIGRHAPGQGRVLAMGSAPGAFFPELQRSGYECFGANIPDGLPPATGWPACDLFLAFDAAQYTLFPLVFWKEVARALQPGGMAFLQTAVGVCDLQNPLEIKPNFFKPEELPFIHTSQSARKLADLAGLDLVAVEDAAETSGRVCVLRKPLPHLAA
jgi:hypothetical protein